MERVLQQAEIGIIGGSGLYSMPGLTATREERVSTPFGEPSDAFVLGELDGARWPSSPATAGGIGYFHQS